MCKRYLEQNETRRRQRRRREKLALKWTNEKKLHTEIKETQEREIEKNKKIESWTKNVKKIEK